MQDKETKQELADMDDYLKQLIVQHWDMAIKSRIEGDLRKSFLSYKALLHVIEPYEFTTKDSLLELTQAIQNFFDSLGGKPMTSRAIIQMGNEERTVRDLVDIYQSEIPKAYKELNLWLKSILKFPDIDNQFSFETFNSEISTLQGKKKELLKDLTMDQLLDYMSRQSVHDVHARYRWSKALKKQGVSLDEAVTNS